MTATAATAIAIPLIVRHRAGAPLMVEPLITASCEIDRAHITRVVAG
jgi:hypothetical protein